LIIVNYVSKDKGVELQTFPISFYPQLKRKKEKKRKKKKKKRGRRKKNNISLTRHKLSPVKA